VPEARRGSSKRSKTKRNDFVFDLFGLVTSGRQTGSARPIGFTEHEILAGATVPDPCHPRNPRPRLRWCDGFVSPLCLRVFVFATV